jgi:hypothetical protein
MVAITVAISQEIVTGIRGIARSIGGHWTIPAEIKGLAPSTPDVFS